MNWVEDSKSLTYQQSHRHMTCSSLGQKPEASSTMRAVSSARCIDVRLYTSRIKIGRSRALALLNSPQVNNQWRVSVDEDVTM